MSATEPTTDLTLDVERFLQMLAAGTFVDEPPIVAPADALEILFSSQIDNDNGQRDMYLDILGFGFNYLINPNKRLRVSTMHRNLAKKYQENGRENETDKDVLDGLLKDEDEKAKGNEKFLAYLLAHGTQGFNILNVILNPATYEAADFHLDTVKPLIRFLLHIHPALLGGSTTYKISQPPIFTALQIKATAYTRNNGCDPPMTFEPSVKQDIISFLCDTRNDGLGSTEAIKSLAQMVSNTTGSCNAIHRIIESADFDISETLLRELSRITTSDVHGHTETCCLETLDSQGRTCLHIALTAPVNERKIWWAEMLAKRFPDLLKACTYTSTTKKHSSTGKRLTPLQHFMEQKMKTISEMSTDEDDLKLFFQLEKLEFFLKHQCLLNFDDLTCKTIMYDEDNAKESFLVLENETVSWDTLESQQLHYKLDTFLRRVQILKNVFIHWDDASSMAHRIARSWDCAGNIDMFMIFYWLMKEARVKKILEVVVCDGAGQEETTGDILAVTKNPHSDQAIIECLWGFGIEILDWERIDIPAETIISAVGDSVKRLHLYCSGRKAVLQSWADTRGLSRLQNLEYVSVVIYQGLESITRISNYAAQFHRDLGDTFNSMNPQRKSLIIKYEIVPRAKLSNLEVKSQNEQDFEEQDWLRCMDEFADIMEVVEQQTSLSGPSIQKPTHQIRVALIDDGVKTSYAGLNSNIHTGISVWQPSDSKSTEFANDKPAHYRNYNSSHTGHGTVMAYYIKRLCPKVRLYVAKLDCKSHRGGNGGYSANVTFSLDSVIQAIEWAVEQEVDIISMSWAIEKCRNNNPSYKRLRDAIQAAVEKNIIMFCANPDRGTDFPVNDTYPFSMDKDHIICVGAATRNGVRWAQIDAQDDSCSYFLPGVELGIQVKTELERNPDGPPHEWRKHSGSSLSCALAAGLAAMILHCSLVSGVARFDSPEWKWLRSHEGMHKAFRTIQIDRSTSGWLPVRRFFNPVVRHLGGTNGAKLQAIHSLMEDIFRAMPPSAA